jgi:hypothetical protein
MKARPLIIVALVLASLPAFAKTPKPVPVTYEFTVKWASKGADGCSMTLISGNTEYDVGDARSYCWLPGQPGSVITGQLVQTNQSTIGLALDIAYTDAKGKQKTWRWDVERKTPLGH